MDEQADVTEGSVADTLVAYGLVLGTWRRVEEGIRNVVVWVTDAGNGSEYYIKFYSATPPHTRDVIEREVAFINDLAAHGIPVARYVARQSGGFVHEIPHPKGVTYITVMRKIPGVTPVRYTPRLVDDLAQEHARMHAVGAQYQEGRSFKPLEYYHFMPAIAADTALRELETAMGPIMAHVNEGWSRMPGGLVHLDLRRTNVLTVEDMVTGVIDFDDLSQAPFMFCLAGTLWDILEAGDTEQDVRNYVQQYEKAGRKLTAIERAILPDMVLMRGWVALHGLFFGTGRTSAVSERTLRLLVRMYKNGVAIADPTVVGSR